MATKDLKTPRYKFFSIAQFLETYLSRWSDLTGSTSASAKKYLEKLYSLVSSYEEIVLNADGSILSWNEKFQVLEGYSEKEILGQNLNLFFPPEERQNKIAEGLIAKASSTGVAVHFGQLVRKDGTLFPGSIKIVRVNSKDGIHGFIAFCQKMRTDREKTA